MDPFMGEIRSFGFNFAPSGWAQCNGKLLPISQNTALFSLLGTYYGGDGKSTFALPNLQGAAPMHQGQGPSERVIGEAGGGGLRNAGFRAATRAHALPYRIRTSGERERSERLLLGRSRGEYVQSHGVPGAADGADNPFARRREPTPQQHATLPHHELLHRAPGRLPCPTLTILTEKETRFVRRIYN